MFAAGPLEGGTAALNLDGRARRPPQQLVSEGKGGDAAAGEHRDPVDLEQDVADMNLAEIPVAAGWRRTCLLYTSPSPRD